MQFGILLIGALLFAFYSFQPAPLYFNEAAYQQLKHDEPAKIHAMEQSYVQLHRQYQRQAISLSSNRIANNVPAKALSNFRTTQAELQLLRDSVKNEISRNHYSTDSGDTNYVFLYFVTHTLPRGLIGLLFAVIFLASWGSISAALNSLASSSLIDIQFLGKSDLPSEKRQLFLGRMHTLAWGIFCIIVAMFATRMGSLIEAVNVLGSLFYGTILGIFLVAFYVKNANGKVVFLAAIITEICVVVIYNLNIVSFLWLNVIGALLVVLISLLGRNNNVRSKQEADIITVE